MTLVADRVPVVEPVYYGRGTCPQCGFNPGDSWYICVTNREREVLALVAQGYSNKMVAKQLGINVTTVKNHLTNLMAKMGCHDRTSAAMIALDKGLIRRVGDDGSEVGEGIQASLEDGEDAGYARHSP